MDFENLKQKIQFSGETVPFLLMSPKLEALHTNLEAFLRHMFSQDGVDVFSLFFLRDDGQSLKIETIKEFLAKSYITANFWYQVFVIENFSRATVQAQNACLKILEEPWKGNIFFLTSESESSILDTILSRVQIVKEETLFSEHTKEIDFFYDLIFWFVKKGDFGLFRYIHTHPIEKTQALAFLHALFLFVTQTGEKSHILETLLDDISAIEKHNALPKYIVDKYIFQL